MQAGWISRRGSLQGCGGHTGAQINIALHIPSLAKATPETGCKKSGDEGKPYWKHTAPCKEPLAASGFQGTLRTYGEYVESS
jgi:hypothetical protein